MKKIFVMAILSFAFLLSGFALSHGATLTVTKIADTNDNICNSDCSLREAIFAAASGDTIEFSSPLFDTPQTITLAQGELFIGRPLTINGRGASMTIISGNNASRILVNYGNTVINGLAFTNGRQSGSGVVRGGGIFNETTLTLNDCIVSGNTVVSTDFRVFGAGIYNNDNANLTIRRSVISGNSASVNVINSTENRGGGIYNSQLATLLVESSEIVGNSVTSQNINQGGGIFISGTAKVINTTISGNRAFNGIGAEGGGIYVIGTLTLLNSTVTANSANFGGGAYKINTGTLHAVNSIISGNSGLNVTGGLNANINNYLDGDARLKPLGFYGGTTRTHAPLPDSPVLNAGSNCVLTVNDCFNLNPALTTDQRGSGYPRRIGTNVDIGAVENSRVVTNDNTSGAGSLRQAIIDAEIGSTIEFDSAFFNQPRTISIALGGELVVNKNLTINGPGANLLSLSGFDGATEISSRLFFIDGGATLNLSGVRLTFAFPIGGNGGAVYINSGTLNANSITIDRCSASIAGAIFNNGTLNLTNSTVIDNQASNAGAIYNEAGRTVNISNSNISNNATSGNVGGIQNKGTLTITNSTMTNDRTVGTAGAISNEASGNATVSNSTIENGFANNGAGGAIYNSGVFTLTNSTVSGNRAALGGGITNDGTFVLMNSTVSGNRSTTNKGGGIYNSNGKVLHLLNATVTNNQSDNFAGAGIWNENFGNPTITLRTRNSIIAGNISGAGNPVDFVGDMVNLGNNLVNNSNPGLAPLGNYGGTTQTHALLLNSPALNAGDNCAITANSCGIGHPALPTDQRGSQRKIGAQIDMGAFERNITLDQATLPNGERTTPYSQQLTVTRATSFVELLSLPDLSESLTPEALAAPFTFSVIMISGQGLPPGLSLASNGVLSGTPTQAGTFTFTVKVADTDGMAGVAQYSITIAAFNNSPTITGATISRQAGSVVSNSTIATNVGDVESGANGVTVTITSANPSNGVTVSSIVNTNGTVTANVLAACGATNATFTLTASDGNKTTNATLTVNVSANSAPTLVYPNSTVLINNSLNISPTTATDNGTVSYSLLSVTPSMTTAPTVNSSTGAVSITNANPLGTYIITVRATDNCGATTDASFTLNVSLPIKTVTKIADTDDGVCDADCSLREAIATAPSGYSIEFASPLFDTTQTITLVNGNLYVPNKTLTINGKGAQLTIISGNNQSRVFNNDNSNLTLNGLTITNGKDPVAVGGGGIYNRGTMTINNCIVSGNSTIGGNGGGIYNNSTFLAINNSTISANTASSSSGGGGIYLNSLSQLVINNSTISGNSTTNSGGGIYTNQSNLRMNNSTITANSSQDGGGIFDFITDKYIQNTIISGNSAPNFPDFHVLGGAFFMNNSNFIGGDARLAPLGFYGGATQTHALLPNSPVLNAGNNCVLTANACASFNPALTTDQRGTNAQRKIGTQVDIGAFEQNITLDQTSLPDNNQTFSYNQTLTATRATSFARNLSTTDKKDILDSNNLLAPFTFSIVTIAGQQLPPGLSLASNGTISGTTTTPGTYTFTVKASDADGMSGVSQYTINVLAFNNPPTITGATISRQQGSPVSNSTIATNVNDVESGANGVTVTVTSANPSNGVTVSNIVNTNGTVTADVIAGCGAGNATFTLTASDGSKTTNATLTVTVSANTQPTLAYPSPVDVVQGDSINISPSIVSDNGSIVSYTLVSVTPSLPTAPTVNSSGVVSIVNAQPSGSYTIKVRATDNCGLERDATFVLNIIQTARTVTKTADTNDGVCDSDCSLREAVAVAGAGSPIKFSSLFDAPQTITLASPIVNGKSLTIDGSGKFVTISGNNQTPLFQTVNANILMTFIALTLTDGLSVDSSNGGGAISIAPNSQVYLINSAITNNTSSTVGGAIYAQGGARLTVINSTIAGNSANLYGGGIFCNFGSTVNLINATITNNLAGGNGGGINSNNATVNVRNTIIAGNSGAGPDVMGLLTSQGNNLIGNTSGTNLVGDTTGNILNQSAKFAPLGNYGGVAQTYALMPDSPAINAGNNCVTNLTCATNNPPFAIILDGRGAVRQVGSFVDMGAVEQSITFNQSSLPNTSASLTYNQTLTVTRQGSFTGPSYTKDTNESLAPFTFEIVPIAGQQLPPGLTLNPNGQITGQATTQGTYTFTVKATDTADGISGVQQFVIQVFPPTAAMASVSGRVLNPEGIGLVNAKVILTDSVGNSRVVTTSSLGYYKFDEVEVGQSYILSVTSKRYLFIPQFLKVTGETADLILLAQP